MDTRPLAASPRAIAGLAFALSLALTPGSARADCSLGRPTEAGAYFSEDVAPYSPQHLDTARLRLHFVTSGPAAVPDLAFVELAGQIGEEALDHYAALGFAAPLSDVGPGACAEHGGDGRIDVYFVDFAAGDGQALAERCEASSGAVRCAGFALVDATLEHYPSHEVGLRTVLPHELFHLVQQASNAELPGWLAEGTAQWAADHVHPALTDLEGFVGAYYEEAHRSIDSPPGGAAVGFSYGTAVWPVYLEQRFGVGALVSLFELLAEGDEVWQATEQVLEGRGSSLAEAWSEIAVWHVATAGRAGLGGFADGSKYPSLPLATLEPAGVSDAFAGLGLRAYAVSAPGGALLELDVEPSRVAAFAVPLEGGLADVAASARLPVEVAPSPEGYVVVVAGITPSKLDAPYALSSTPLGGGGGAGGLHGAGGGGGAAGADRGADASAQPPAAPASCSVGATVAPVWTGVGGLWLVAWASRRRALGGGRRGRAGAR